MDPSRKREREAGENTEAGRRQRQQQQEAVAAEVAEALEKGTGGVGEDEPWQRPPGVFELPWQKCRGGLGKLSSAAGGGAGWELRDVFFQSLVDGGVAAIGIPGDRLASPTGARALSFDEVDALLADAEPLWRRPAVVEGPPNPAA